MLRIRDAADAACTALFKWPPDDAPEGELYAIGMERVAATLGAYLDLPVCDVYLERF
jgi:hypothetical protein